jgi:hypothetical protein
MRNPRGLEVILRVTEDLFSRTEIGGVESLQRVFRYDPLSDFLFRIGRFKSLFNIIQKLAYQDGRGA